MADVADDPGYIAGSLSHRRVTCSASGDVPELEDDEDDGDDGDGSQTSLV